MPGLVDNPAVERSGHQDLISNAPRNYPQGNRNTPLSTSGARGTGMSDAIGASTNSGNISFPTDGAYSFQELKHNFTKIVQATCQCLDSLRERYQAEDTTRKVKKDLKEEYGSYQKALTVLNEKIGDQLLKLDPWDKDGYRDKMPVLDSSQCTDIRKALQKAAELLPPGDMKNSLLQYSQEMNEVSPPDYTNTQNEIKDLKLDIRTSHLENELSDIAQQLNKLKNRYEEEASEATSDSKLKKLRAQQNDIENTSKEIEKIKVILSKYSDDQPLPVTDSGKTSLLLKSASKKCLKASPKTAEMLRDLSVLLKAQWTRQAQHAARPGYIKEGEFFDTVDAFKYTSASGSVGVSGGLIDPTTQVSSLTLGGTISPSYTHGVSTDAERFISYDRIVGVTAKAKLSAGFTIADKVGASVSGDVSLRYQYMDITEYDNPTHRYELRGHRDIHARRDQYKNDETASPLKKKLSSIFKPSELKDRNRTHYRSQGVYERYIALKSQMKSEWQNEPEASASSKPLLSPFDAGTENFFPKPVHEGNRDIALPGYVDDFTFKAGVSAGIGARVGEEDVGANLGASARLQYQYRKNLINQTPDIPYMDCVKSAPERLSEIPRNHAPFYNQHMASYITAGDDIMETNVDSDPNEPQDIINTKFYHAMKGLKELEEQFLKYEETVRKLDYAKNDMKSFVPESRRRDEIKILTKEKHRLEDEHNVRGRLQMSERVAASMALLSKDMFGDEHTTLKNPNALKEAEDLYTRTSYMIKNPRFQHSQGQHLNHASLSKIILLGNEDNTITLGINGPFVSGELNVRHRFRTHASNWRHGEQIDIGFTGTVQKGLPGVVDGLNGAIGSAVTSAGGVLPDGFSFDPGISGNVSLTTRWRFAKPLYKAESPSFEGDKNYKLAWHRIEVTGGAGVGVSASAAVAPGVSVSGGVDVNHTEHTSVYERLGSDSFNQMLLHFSRFRQSHPTDNGVAYEGTAIRHDPQNKQWLKLTRENEVPFKQLMCNLGKHLPDTKPTGKKELEHYKKENNTRLELEYFARDQVVAKQLKLEEAQAEENRIRADLENVNYRINSVKRHPSRNILQQKTVLEDKLQKAIAKRSETENDLQLNRSIIYEKMDGIIQKAQNFRQMVEQNSGYDGKTNHIMGAHKDIIATEDLANSTFKTAKKVKGSIEKTFNKANPSNGITKKTDQPHKNKIHLSDPDNNGNHAIDMAYEDLMRDIEDFFTPTAVIWRGLHSDRWTDFGYKPYLKDPKHPLVKASNAFNAYPHMLLHQNVNLRKEHQETRDAAFAHRNELAVEELDKFNRENNRS